jgi:hypothetical protein
MNGVASDQKRRGRAGLVQSISELARKPLPRLDHEAAAAANPQWRCMATWLWQLHGDCMKHTNWVPVIVVGTVIVFAGMWGRNARASEPTENRRSSGTTVRVVVHHDGHIRVDNERISEVLRYAMKRSASFGNLIASIEMLDRVVYIQEGHCHHSTQRACIQLMPTPGAKNLLVKIDPRQPIRTVVAQLAHELYHAHEIAREPDVVDAAFALIAV